MNGKKKSKEKELKINLGCGRKHIKGFVNVDIRKACKPDILCNAKELPYEGSVDKIIASDLLEHFSRLETKKVLEHWYATLKPGGILIIKTPNVDTLIKAYLDAKIDFPEFIRKMYGQQDYFGNYHYTGFNPTNIQNILESVGFKIINLQPMLEDADWSNMAVRCQK